MDCAEFSQDGTVCYKRRTITDASDDSDYKSGASAVAISTVTVALPVMFSYLR